MRRKRKSLVADVLGIVMTDFFICLAGAVLSMFMLVVFLINETKSAGTFEVVTIWDHTANIDIDTWGKVDDRPWVGFSNMGTGDGLTLVYDDKGHDGHKVLRNFENMYARELIPGKWAINIHYYAFKQSGPVAVDVNVMVKIKENSGSTFRELVDETITLRSVDEEVTVCTFEIDTHGKVIDNSVQILPPTVYRAHQ